MENKQVPEIRFAGFSGEWKKRKLSEVMDFSNGINAPKESYGKGRKMISVMDILDQNPMTYENIRNSVEVKKEIEEKNRVENGDLVFVRSSEIVEEVGWTKAYLEDEYSLYSGFTIRGKKKNEYDAKFIELNLNSTSRRQIERKAGGSTRFNVSQAILKNIVIGEPNIEEQIKLGNLFKSLDKTIAIHQQELEILKQTKQGFLQKIFSREIRFKDGKNEFPSWTSVILKEILSETNEKTTSNNENQVLSSTTTGLFRQKDFFNRDIASSDNIGYKILRKGQVVLSPQNLWMGNINYNNLFEIGIVSPSYKVFKINKEYNKELVGSLLKTSRMLYEYMISSEQGASIVRRNLDMNLFYSIKVKIPTSQVEQQKIAEFLCKLDDTIALHEQELETLKQTKKAFLQKMFI